VVVLYESGHPHGVSVLSHPGVGTRSVSSHLFSPRIAVARAIGVVGLVVYNWWVIVPFEHGWLTSVDGFFSDMSADGQAHAGLLQRADMLAGVLLVTALVLRGPVGSDGTRRREWRWQIVLSPRSGNRLLVTNPGAAIVLVPQNLSRIAIDPFRGTEFVPDVAGSAD